MRSLRLLPKRPLKHLLARGLLALAFLFAQQTATLHWLSHATDAARAKGAASSTLLEHCDECLALSALGAGALPGAPGLLPTTAARHALLPAPAAAPSPAALRLAFRSRAPPVQS